jgi:uncharacterized damage-inducible protein DinB
VVALPPARLSADVGAASHDLHQLGTSPPFGDRHFFRGHRDPGSTSLVRPAACEHWPVEDEKHVLLDSLNKQREHVLGILDGLSSEALHQAVLPSGWTSLGLVNHLSFDVERFWFREVLLGETFDDDSETDPVSAWLVPADANPEAVLGRYRHEVERANAVITSTPLDAPPKAWPDFFGEWRLADLREILVHVIAETATHAGHLDAVREIIDGRTWLRLT